MLIRTTLYTIYLSFAGAAIAAGYVAFITLLGVFEKLGCKLRLCQQSACIEWTLICGVTLGNLIFLYDKPLTDFGILSALPLGVFTILFVIFNLFGGIFIGALAGALAETLNVFPIISRRFNIRHFLPYVLIAGALGKAVGAFIELYVFN